MAGEMKPLELGLNMEMLDQDLPAPKLLMMLSHTRQPGHPPMNRDFYFLQESPDQNSWLSGSVLIAKPRYEPFSTFQRAGVPKVPMVIDWMGSLEASL